MDASRFDQLARSLTESGTRRALLRLVAGLPLLSGLAAFFSDEDDVDAKNRRKKRKKPHKRAKRHRKHKRHAKKPCRAHARTKTCAGTCGKIKNNCKKTVNCGPCDCDPPCGSCEMCSSAFVCEACAPCCNDVCCPQANAICHLTDGACCVPDSHAQTCEGQCGDITNNCGQSEDCGACTCGGGCPTCFVCDAETNACVVDPDEIGDDCGENGQVCQPDGSCACTEASCPDCTTCALDGTCASCPFCCDGSGVCQDGDANTVCGEGGETCDDCTAQELACVGRACVCTASSCSGCCDGSGPGSSCAAGASDERCGTNGATCDDCTASGESCCDGGCADLETDPDHCGDCATVCAAGEDCCDGDCFDLQTDHDHCGSCTNACEASEICVAGACQTCDVVDGQDLAAAVGAALNGDTLYICAGTYAGGFIISTNIALIGAGQGADGTVIEGGTNVVTVNAGTAGQPVELTGLRIQGGSRGIANFGNRHLRMTDCTVRDNTVSGEGAGIFFLGGTLRLTGCTLEANTATNGLGGGLRRVNGPTTLTDCLIQGNTASFGGGIHNQGLGSDLTLIGTRVTANTATNQSGSGISNTQNGTVTLDAASSVCANIPPTNQCSGFADPNNPCQVTCPA